VPVAIGPDRLVAWVRAVEQFNRGRHITAIGRFSDPPRLEDLASLVLPDGDLEALRACRPGDCLVKLSDSEIVKLRQAATSSGDWKRALHDSFRRVVLARVQAYLADGQRSLQPYSDSSTPTSTSAAFAQLASRADLREPYSTKVFDYLQQFPRSGNAAESILYWALEQFSGAKPVITVTHAAVFRGLNVDREEALVVSKQIFATHYFNASLSLSQTVAGADGKTYLLYLRRVRLDLPEGVFGSLLRRMIQSKVKSQVPAALNELRQRLESGPPLPSLAAKDQATKIAKD
jgi:hypothetical protein